MEPAVVRAMNASPLFAGMAIDESSIRIETLRKGRLFDDVRGSCACVGLVVEGSVDVYNVAEDGSEIRLSSLKTGDSFGICNLCSNDALPTVLRCRSTCRVMLMPKRRFAAMLETNPVLAMRYARVCNEKIAFLIKRIAELSQVDSTMKLETYLREHADENGTVHLEGTRDELARYLGMSRSALFRQMAKLKETGVVCSHGRTLRLASYSQDACRPPKRNDDRRRCNV